jgi:hypothetical protein
MMVKLVILIEPEVNQDAFFEGWPRFLEHAENLPGLVRLVSAPVHTHLAGSYQPLMIHELVFDSQQALESALASDEGVAAGKTLQTITGGAVTLLVAGHLEDSGDNLRSYRSKTNPDSKG